MRKSSTVCLGLDELIQEIWQTAEDHGFHASRANLPEPFKELVVLSLITSEAGEAAEGIRKGDNENYLEELADIMIRVLDAAEDFNQANPTTTSFIKVLLKKIETNHDRPIMHGKLA